MTAEMELLLSMTAGFVLGIYVGFMAGSSWPCIKYGRRR